MQSSFRILDGCSKGQTHDIEPSAYVEPERINGDRTWLFDSVLGFLRGTAPLAVEEQIYIMLLVTFPLILTAIFVAIIIKNYSIQRDLAIDQETVRAAALGCAGRGLAARTRPARPAPVLSPRP